ncbi:beta family protein [Micromonospora sp. NBS 11-29]|uniref:beta family protein n=1 Tax=Micromonospora sp. NBS 11-29 TaxID=1960879 RepID=UPI0020CDE3B0|nr:beta family protein [Micromonospora sp. NBS 11-29]
MSAPGGAPDPVYRPVLAGRRGELDALAHLDATAAGLIAPIVDVPREEVRPARALGRLPAGLVPAVDVSALPDAPEHDPVRWGVPLVPVIGLAESDRRLGAHGAAARAWTRRAVVRLRVGLDRVGPDAATAAAERVWRSTGLAPEQCDLLLDTGDVCCLADVRTVEPRVRRAARWAGRHAWRSVTVAAGGMPPTPSGLPTDEPVRLERYDWLLWHRVADLGLGYGDYGVSCATRDPDAPGDRLPTLRWTADDAWWVYRWCRRGGRGDERIADLCRTLVAAPHWPATGAGFSWGDHEVLRRARRGAGAGSPANWIAWSTSHHLAYVLAALTPPGTEQRDDSWRAGRNAPERGRAGRVTPSR